MMTLETKQEVESSSNQDSLDKLKEMNKENINDKDDKIEEEVLALMDSNLGILKDSQLEEMINEIPLGKDSIWANVVVKIKAEKKSNLTKPQLISLYNIFQQKKRLKQKKPKKPQKSKLIYRVKIDDDCKVFLNTDGIHVKEMKVKGKFEVEVDADPYAWESLNILCKYKVDYKTHVNWLYDYALVRKTPNGTMAVQYEGHSLEEIRNVLNQNCYQAKSGGKKHILNSVLDYYFNSAKHKSEKDTVEIKKKEIIYEVLLSEFIPSQEYQNNPFFWVIDIKKWYGYTDNHFYEIVDEEYVLSQVQVWLRKNKISLKKTTLYNGLLNLKLDLKKFVRDFDNKRYITLKNGIWDKSVNHLIDFKSDLLIIRYVPRVYNKEITERPELWKRILKVFKLNNPDSEKPSLSPVWTSEDNKVYPKDEVLWEQYGINMAHFDFCDRLFMVLVGRPSAGKSPLIDIYKDMMGDYVSATVSFLKCGDKGEMSVKDALKPVWAQNEMSMGYATNDTMKLLKAIHSKDPYYTLRPLWMDRLEMRGNKFMFGATNQTFRMSDSYNKSSSFKRICPLFCPNVFKRDTKLESEFRDETFLDSLFSYLLNQKVKEIIDYVDEMEFWDRNEAIWQWSAYSVKRACKLLYERSYEVEAKIKAMKVFNKVSEKLLTLVPELPKKLTKRIKYAMEDMGITFRRNHEYGDNFLGIKEIDEKSEKNPFTIIEEPIIAEAKKTLLEKNDGISIDDVLGVLRLTENSHDLVKNTLEKGVLKEIFVNRNDEYFLPTT